MSLFFTFAEIFGLDIFYISLLEFTLMESDLNWLFNNLFCYYIVFLEDIDTIDLLRTRRILKKKQEGLRAKCY